MVDKAFRFQDTTATKKVFHLRKRIRAVAGGTGASKTISILVWCIDYAQSTKNHLISVVSESYPHLLGGAMKDFEQIMRDRGYWKESQWVRNPKPTYTFETGSQIEFLSVDTVGKAHGPRRDVLFINEANNLSYPIARQLMLRTREIVWLDWNPSSEFWYYTELEGKREDIDFLHLTYLDNEALDRGQLQEIEALRSNRFLWQVYGLGQLGEVEGKIYKDWQIIDEIPHEAKLERYGLDFGYTNDPTAIVAVYRLNQGIILDEITYQKGLSNKAIADILLNQPKALVVADSAEPKSIDEIYSYGVQVIPSLKGPDSVAFGIHAVQDQRISVTKRSVNVIKEYRNYLWMTDKDGRILNEPEHTFSHTMDAIRYAIVSIPKLKISLTPKEREDKLFREAMKRKHGGEKRRGVSFMRGVY